ncbi:VOC family protein [Microbacterium sp. UCD-TDU]|uniref:VOC family protein n=1 Tax=Microbacterium sp. UCD-TDU TaxID=1247714 RepID=UPI0003460B3F|nr:VOC family protein [Microbacterium sp. UCD-TDU]EYT57139.1 hypothetical protein D514_0118705 [Microbacterium sp. UCD-TDU]
MTIDFSKTWHVGIVVDDLDRAIERSRNDMDLAWTSVLQRDVTITRGGREETSPVRWAASCAQAPQWEMIEAATGIWSTTDTDGEALHHLAYWSDDLEADAASLEAAGYTREAHGTDEEGRIRFVYLISPEGVRIELGATWSKPAWDDWVAGGGYAVQF